MPSAPPSAAPYGAAPAPQPAPGYPYPSDPASQVAQPGLPAQPVATQPAAQPAATLSAAQPQARSFKQLFKKIGDHAKQQARDVAGNTMNYTTDAANSVLDNTLTSGSDLVKTKVQSTAGGLGGVGQALFGGVKGQDEPKDLAVALSAGRVVLHQLRFQEHTATLDPSSGPLLAKLTQALLATPGQYLIEVHVDQTEGPRAQALSDQRAAAVKNALVSSGVPPTQLAAAGYGASRPPSTGSSERIEIMRTQ
jgi:outer membrane protein OmpA-like peptidoglycan-associated protein